MSLTLSEVPPPLTLSPPPEGRAQSPIPAVMGVALCFLLAVVQVAFAGYQLGAGNQPIQIAFLKHLANPALFNHDLMIHQTLALYPTYFFRMLAPLLAVAGLAPLYLVLQILTSFLTLTAVYLLGRSIFKSHAAALMAVLLMVAGHHRALAGEWLYTAWFTHTQAALPLALLALALVYRGGGGVNGRSGRWRMVAAFALGGLLFNLHALTAAYALFMMGFALLGDLKDIPWKKWIVTGVLCLLAAGLFAAPTLWQMKGAHQYFDPAWVNLMRVRSADHSFPSTWWAAGDLEIPRFILIFALFVLSWSFSPVRRQDTARALRVTILMTAAVGLLFVCGYVFSEIWPVPFVIRLQPFRASRLMLVLMLVHIAYGAVEAIRVSFSGKAMIPAARAGSPPADVVPAAAAPATTPAPDSQETSPGSALRIALAPAARVAEFLAAVLVLATLGLPTLLPLLPLTVLAVLIAALISGRLGISQTLVAVAALAITVLAWRQIQFPIPFLSHELSLLPRQWSADWFFLTTLAAALGAAVLIALFRKPVPRFMLLAFVLAMGSWGSWELFHQDLRTGPGNPAPALAAVAHWAQAHTPTDAVFMAPTGMSDFRIFADRALVGDWRDGTQLYFSASFGPEWMARMADLEPGLLLSPDGSHLVARGRPLSSLDDDALLALAKKYQANYILLPTPPASHPRTLEAAYTGASFTAYLPKVAPSEIAIPAGVVNPAEWTAMEKFMHTTVAQNIDKYRKADLTIQILDPAGRPVQDLPATLEQTSHGFNFGVSMSFFEPNDTIPYGDQKAPPMTPEQLTLIPEVFNASMIGFTGKWMYIEPADGERHYSDLDKYIDFCQAHHMDVEFHFLTGLLPAFLRRDQRLAAERLPEHAREVVARYYGKVKYWQVCNDGYLLRSTPPVFKELRAKYPGIKLGVSDCVRLFSDRADPKARDNQMFKGFNDLLWLKSQGAHPDFYSLHGHQPYGLWADPREMYRVFDRYQEEGCRVHISEFFIPLGSQIIGNVRRGRWMPDSQADYLVRFMTVCYSHPDVDMVNLWGIAAHGWGASAGLLDNQDKPRPAFLALKKLLNETWHTHVDEALPLDGIISTRAFHGNYSLTLTLSDGRKVATTLTVPQTTASHFQYVLDTATGTLTAKK